MKNKRFKKALSVFLSILMIMSAWVWVAPTEAEAAASEGVTSSFTLSPQGNRGSTEWTRLALTGEGAEGGTSIIVFNFSSGKVQSLAAYDDVKLKFYAYSCPSRIGSAKADVYYVTSNQTYIDGISDTSQNVADTGNAILGTTYTGTAVQNSAKAYFGLSNSYIGTFNQPAIDGQNNTSNRTGAANCVFDVTDIVKSRATAGESLSFVVMLQSAYNCSASLGWSDIYINSDTITLSEYNVTEEAASLKSAIDGFETKLASGNSRFYFNITNAYATYNEAKRYYDAVVYGGVAFDAAIAQNYITVLNSALSSWNDTYVDYLNQTFYSRNGNSINKAYTRNLIWNGYDFSWDITASDKYWTRSNIVNRWAVPNTIIGITDDRSATFPVTTFFHTGSSPRYMRYIVAGSGTYGSIVGTSVFTPATWKVASSTHTTSNWAAGTDGWGDWYYDSDVNSTTIPTYETSNKSFALSTNTVYQASTYMTTNTANVGVGSTNFYTTIDFGITWGTNNNSSNDYANAYASNSGHGYIYAVYMEPYRVNYNNWASIIPNLSIKNYNGYVYDSASVIAGNLDSASAYSVNLPWIESQRVGDISSTVSDWATRINNGANNLADAKSNADGASRITTKYTDLINAISAADSIYSRGSKYYTPSTWSAFETAYNAARNHMAALDPNGTGNQYSSDSDAVGALATALTNAKNALEYVTIKFVDYAGNTVKTLSAENDEVYIGTTADELASQVPANTALTKTENKHTIYSWPGLSTVTDSKEYKEIATEKDHNYPVVWTTTKEATCSEEGTQTRTCLEPGCGYVATQTIAKLAHTPAAEAKENEVLPTCDTPGSYDMVVRCSKCNEIISSTKTIVPASGHNWDEGTVTVDPSCTTDGTKLFTCTTCGRIRNEVVNREGHKYTYVTTEPTYETAGETVGTCSACGDTVETEIPKLVDDKAPEFTFTGNGNADNRIFCKEVYITISDDRAITLSITKDGEEYIPAQAALANTENTTSFALTEVGEYKIIATDASTNSVEKELTINADHTVDSWTSVDDNNHNGICTNCGETVTAAHSFTNPVLARPTLADGTWTNGTYTYTCICGATKTESTERADYTELDKAVEALEELNKNENLTDDAKTEIAEALEKAENLADNLVTAEQSKIDELVKELQDVKADVEKAISEVVGSKPVTDADSGIKVKFLKATGVDTVEYVQLGATGGFPTVRMRLTNGNADLPIKVTSVVADKAYIGADNAASSAVFDTPTTLDKNGGSKDLYIVAPTAFNEAGIITYTITYTIDGLKGADGNPVTATTKAYLYVKGEKFTPYHLMDEDCANVLWGDAATSEWDYTLESSVGDFAPVYNNKAPLTEFGNENLQQDKGGAYVYDLYDYENYNCFAGCTGTGDTPYVKGDAHAATYRYYIDTSLASTWQDAGFRAVIAETYESLYDNAALKYIRLANNQAYLDSISESDKTFTVTLVPGASSNVPTKRWTTTSDGSLTVSHYQNSNEDEYVFGNYLDDAQTWYTAYENFAGYIPQDTEAAKMMFSTRMEINKASGGIGAQAEAVTMTTHLYITSYDKAELREAVANAETAGYNSAYYDAEKYEAYENALKTAKEVLGKAETNQGEIDAATAALNTAIENLNKADAEAKFILTVIHSIHENADKNSKATSTEYDYYLVNGDITPAQIDLTDMKINKKSDIANLTITEDTEYTYYYWYIDYSGAQDAIKKAEEIINNADDYNPDFVTDVTNAKEDLEDSMASDNSPASQDDANTLLDALTGLTGHTCADSNNDHNCDVCGDKLTDCADVTTDKDHNCDLCGAENVTEHEYVNPVLTRPTYNKETGEWTNGVYTSTCNCGTTETTNIARADYEEYDAVKVALEALLANDKLTQAAKNKITAALEANKIDDNYVATAEEQKLIDDATAALNITLDEINAGISAGSMVYVDLSAYNAAIEIYNNTTKNVAKDTDIDTAQIAIDSVVGITETSTKANGNQDKINTATATLTALNEKYAKCAQNEHSYETVTTAPTCTAQGYTTYTCKVCGHAYTSNFVDANGHSWSNWELKTAPTAETDGTYERTCPVCNAVEEKSVKREDYSAYDEAVKKAEDLLKDEKLTPEAKEVIQNALDEAKELDQNLPADVVVDDKIIIDNDSAEKIKNAADTLEEAIKSLYDENGKLKAEYEKVNFTEYNAAVNAYESLKDNMSEADKNAVAEAMKSVTDANITENTSKADGQDILDEAAADIAEINAKYGECASGNHDWNEGEVSEAPTCEAEGARLFTCQICGTTKTETMATVDHKYETYVSNDNATCQKNATETAECVFNCGETDTRDIADSKVDHSFTNYVSNNNATCQKNATETAECSFNCGETNTRDIADSKVDHSFTNYVSDNNAECEKDGTKTALCDYGCGKTDTITDAGSATNHNYDETKSEANLTRPVLVDGVWQDGYYTYTCKNDSDHTKTEKVSRADYTANEKAVADLNDLLADENLTDAAKKDITDALANNVADNLITTEQDKVNAATDALNEILNKIANDTTGAYEKPDYSEAEQAIEDAENIPDLENTDKEALEKLKNDLQDIKNKKNPEANAKDDQDDIDAIRDEVKDIITKYEKCKHIGTSRRVVSHLNGTHSIQCVVCDETIETVSCTYTVTEVGATCQSVGYTLHECDVCSYSYKDNENGPTDHNWSRWYINEGTCREASTKTRYCDNEGCFAQETVIRTDSNGNKIYGAHSLVIVSGKPATCTVDGYSDYSRCVICNEVTESEVISAPGYHVDNNHNGNCDRCNYLMKPSGNCGCFCHNNSFFGKLLYKFVNFFWKLFKINRNCECGSNHW